MLFVGSIAVTALTFAVITLFAIIKPIVQYLVLFTVSISIPLSIILHRVLRGLVRYLRKRRALARGRQVYGIVEPQKGRSALQRGLRRLSRSTRDRDYDGRRVSWLPTASTDRLSTRDLRERNSDELIPTLKKMDSGFVEQTGVFENVKSLGERSVEKRLAKTRGKSSWETAALQPTVHEEDDYTLQCGAADGAAAAGADPEPAAVPVDDGPSVCAHVGNGTQASRMVAQRKQSLEGGATKRRKGSTREQEARPLSMRFSSVRGRRDDDNVNKDASSAGSLEA